ncbi:CBO0543 family protein [Pseudalkalibacillus sp. A8]|uniref:CBO0543 family protein n=1 Tax=Pseudalkalibacillus sp. A8 TaxID=3382641 RepID=UPI0038B5C2CD
MIIPEKVAVEIDKIYKKLALVNEEDRQIWFEYELLSWQWFLAFLLSILPWLIWLKFRKKESTNRLLSGAFYIIAISMLLDSFGTELGFWDYRYEVVPFLPSFIPWDLSFLPVIFMFLLQVKPRMSPILKAVLYSIIGTCIGEPVFQWLGYYNPSNWSPVYSFPIYFLKYLVGHILVMSNHYEELKTEEA